MTIEELRALAERHTGFPRLSGYEIYHGLVCGSGRCLDDPRYVTEAEQEAGVPLLTDEALGEIEAGLDRRIGRCERKGQER